MKSFQSTSARASRDNCTLVIMAKAPKPGRVKTRLSHDLPPEAITALYECLLKDTLSLAKSLSGIDVAVMCPESDKDDLVPLVGDAAQVVAQKGEGLAAALTSVFAHFTGGGQRVVAFNSDSPHLPGIILERAFQVLAHNDVVVGPTHDGGYYLVGAKTAHQSLFENDGLGTRSALERLLTRAKLLGLSTGFTEAFYDIDIANDLVLLEEELRLYPAKAPHTAAWFSEWKQTFETLRVREENREDGA